MVRLGFIQPPVLSLLASALKLSMVRLEATLAWSRMTHPGAGALRPTTDLSTSMASVRETPPSRLKSAATTW